MISTFAIYLAAAGIFSLPFDLDNGPPPQLPALTRYEPPIFPVSLRATSVSDGFATMMFTVAGDGRVDEAVAIEASHPAFVQAVEEALDQWRLAPAESATVPRRELIRFEFKRTGMVSAMSQRDASKAMFPEMPAADAQPIRSLAWEMLMQPPERITAASPVYPDALRGRSVKGYAIVNFVIDAAGHVRVPVVAGASEPEFGEAALSAVRQWRFAPPLHEGRTVHVLVERSFTFGGGSRRR